MEPKQSVQNDQTANIAERRKKDLDKLSKALDGPTSPSKRHVLPRWETVRASDMDPIEVQNWLRQLCKEKDLSNPSLVKIRNVMLVIFKHGQRYGFLPRTQEANPMSFVRQSCVSDYEPVVLTLSQCVDVLSGLRISKIPALRWSDIDWQNSCIRVTRAYVYGRFGPPKSRASKRPVPLHPLLAQLPRCLVDFRGLREDVLCLQRGLSINAK